MAMVQVTDSSFSTLEFARRKVGPPEAHPVSRGVGGFQPHSRPNAT